MELQLYDELLLNTNVTLNETIQIENLNTLNIINILSKFLVKYENQTNIDIILGTISNLENVLIILFKMLDCFNLELLFVQTKVSSNCQNLDDEILLLKLIVDTFKVILRLKLSCNISFFTIKHSKEMMKKLLNIVKFNNNDLSISAIRCLINLLFNDPNNVCLFISEDVNGLIILSLMLSSVKDMSYHSSLKRDLFSCVTKIFYMITCQCETIIQAHFASRVDSTIIMIAGLTNVCYLCLFPSEITLFSHNIAVESSNELSLIIQIIKLLFALPLCDVLNVESNEQLLISLTTTIATGEESSNSISNISIVTIKRQLSQIIYFIITHKEIFNSPSNMKHTLINNSCNNSYNHLNNIINLTSSEEMKIIFENTILQLFMDIPDDVIRLIYILDVDHSNISRIHKETLSEIVSIDKSITVETYNGIVTIDKSITVYPYNGIESIDKSIAVEPYNGLIVSSEDVLSKTQLLIPALIRVLNRILEEIKNLKPNEKAANLIPILVVLNRLASIHKDYKDNIKNIVFPNDWLRNSSTSCSIDPKDSPIYTLRGKLCSLMISLDSRLKRTTVDEFVARTGFGNAIALLQIKGLL